METSVVKIIGDAVEYNGEAVARITVGTSTVRDGFEAVLLADKAPDDLVYANFAQAVKGKARGVAQANCITLKELDAILDIVMEK